MAKTSRKTKAKRKDFNKVKLKVGKKKPLANNATVTAFKSQSIYIPDQLKTHDQDEILTRRKQSINDLLSHLTHFSPSFRLQALNGLKEIMTMKKENGSTEASRIVEKVSKCIIDEDSAVRRSCISVLQSIFVTLPEVKMSPFFPLILSHLYCAMTHIFADVQRDSLRVVDLCLQFYPNLVRDHASKKLLQNFLDLISTTEGSKTSKGRILTIKLSKKESAVLWRIRVLARLGELLKISSVPKNTVKIDEKTVSWKSNKISQMLIPPFNRNQGLLLRHIHQSSIVKSTEKTSEELMIIITPLLFQCWLEVCAAGIFSKDDETICTMVHVVAITLHLCTELCENTPDKSEMINWLRKNYIESFYKFFFNNFPYEQPDATKEVKYKRPKRKKTSEEPLFKDQDLNMVNLIICDLVSAVSCDWTIAEDGDKILKVVQYLTSFLNSFSQHSNALNEKRLQYILSSVKRLISLRINEEWHEKLIIALYKYSSALRRNNPQRGRILNFIMSLYETVDASCQNQSFSQLVSSLPTQLVSVLSDAMKRNDEVCKINYDDSQSENLDSVMKCIQCAVRRKNEQFLISLHDNFKNIISLLGNQLLCHANLQCKYCSSLQAKLLECMIPCLPSLSEHDFVSLAHLACSDHIIVENIFHLTEMLVQRVDPLMMGNGIRDPKEETLQILKFLFTVLLGTRNKVFPSADVACDIARHAEVSNHICDALNRMCSDSPMLLHAILKFLDEKIFNTAITSNSKSTLGLLILEKRVISQQNHSGGLENFGKLAADCIVNSLGGEIDHTVSDDMMKCCIDMLQDAKITEQCLKYLTSSDSTKHVAALTKLLRFTELYEIFSKSTSLIVTYISELEKSEVTDVESLHKLKTVMSLIT